MENLGTYLKNLYSNYSIKELKEELNYFLDRAGNIELGQSEFNQPTVKRAGGVFGGLLSKLPPEIRRVGRDVLNDLRRRAPIGRITGGRVFPPFKIPPLNI